MSLSIDADLTGVHDSSRLAKAWEVALTQSPTSASPATSATSTAASSHAGGGGQETATVSSSVAAGARSAQDGLAVVQTADSALQNVASLLRRMEIIATLMSSTADISPVAKAALEAKYEDLKVEVDRIQSSANVRGIDVLAGHNLTFKSGPAPDANVTIDGATTLAPVAASHLSATDHAGVRAAMQQAARQRHDLAALQAHFIEGLRAFGAPEGKPVQPSVTNPGPAETNGGSGLSLLI